MTTNISIFKKELKKWYANNRRSFSWRNTNNPWKILLIETLSQQTQLERANRYYEQFIDKYPTPKHMANDSKKQILKLWSGLGYNNRATRLHETAKIVAKTGFDNLYPDFTVLPGVGPYTNSALLSFAYGEKVIAVDTNVKRILQRFFKIKDKDIKNFLQANQDTFLHRFESRDFNQALMDLGATVCMSKNPKCVICPLEKSCNKFITKNSQIQPKFEGSFRQKRGIVLKILLSKDNVTKNVIQKELEATSQITKRVLDSLEKDNLIKITKNKYIVINDK